MQVVVLVICRKGKSVREAIAKDGSYLSKYSLLVASEKVPGRSPGWLKLRSEDGQPGAVNIVWDANSNVLTARILTRGRSRPSVVVGDFVLYMLARYKKRVRTITIHTVQ